MGANSLISTEISSSVTSDNQRSCTIENNHLSLSAPFSSSTINSLREKLWINKLKSTKEILLPPVESQSATTKDDIESNNANNKISTKIFQLPLPLIKSKINKSPSKQRSQPKSIEQKLDMPAVLSEKKETITATSISKIFTSKQRYHALMSNQTSSNTTHQTRTEKQQLRSTAIPAITKSKYQRIQWDEPYVGVRLDPPTPPCSPSLFVRPQGKGTHRMGHHTSFE